MKRENSFDEEICSWRVGNLPLHFYSFESLGSAHVHNNMLCENSSSLLYF